MSASEPSTKPNAPYSATERLEEAGSEIELVGGLTVRAVEVGAAVLIGLLVCPPLFILVVVVVVPLVALAVLVSLVGAVLATPYLIVQHLRGHRTGHAVLRQRLAHAFHALHDIAPHRLLAAIRRGHPAR